MSEAALQAAIAMLVRLESTAPSSARRQLAVVRALVDDYRRRVVGDGRFEDMGGQIEDEMARLYARLKEAV